MAHDPGRDVVPVKDVGNDKYGGLSCRSKERDYNLSAMTEGSYASKLDRTELENRYLRFFEENINLKKHCHNQEEKIKRLAAKLLRVVAERNLQNKGLPTPKYSDLEVEDLMSRVNELERSNQLLKEKLVVAGIQLSTHHGFVPRSARKSPHRSGYHTVQNISSRSDYCRDRGPENISSNHVTERICRSTDEQKNKYEFLEQEVCKLQKQLINYEKELETVREQSNARVQDLEDELARVQEEGSRMASALSAATAAAHTSARNLEQSSRRVAENVEIIRLQRHIKTQEEHLCALESERREAMEGVQKMNDHMNSLQRENCELKELLNDESLKVCKLQSEVDKSVKEVTIKQLTIDQLQEEINDLRVEKSIIQDANNKIVMSIMDKIIDDGAEKVPAKQQVVSVEKEAVDNSGKHSYQGNADVQKKNGINESHRNIEDYDISWKEKDVETRVMELEEELNKKLEAEMEVQMLKSQEEQKKMEYESQLKELKMLQEQHMVEKETLEKKVEEKDAHLNKCNVKVKKLEEELKGLMFQFQELESTNLKISEKLTAQDVEIQGLQEVEKELTKKLEMQILKELQSGNEEDDKPISLSSNDGEKDESDNLHDEKNEMNEEIAEFNSVQKKLGEVSEQYEAAQHLLQEKEAEIKDFKLEIDKLSCCLDRVKLQNETLILELKKKEEENEILSMKEVSQPQPISKLPAEPNKCIFEMHMDCILISDEGMTGLKRVGKSSSSAPPDVFITWSFFDQEAAYSPLRQGPEVQLNCSYDYTISIKSGLFQYLDEETLLVEMHAAIEDMSVPVAKGIISFRECLNYPGRMICQCAHLISVAEKYVDEKGRWDSGSSFRDTANEGLEFGILQYRFKINCDQKWIGLYKKNKIKEKLKYEQPKDHFKKAPGINRSGTYTKISIKKTKGDSLRSTSIEDECDQPDNDNAKSENIIFPPKPAPRSLKNASFDESTVAHDNVSKLPTPQITIEVHSLRLLSECSVAKDPNVHQLFVEYSFLGKGGENLETPVSLPKPQSNEKLSFNFKRVFPMDPTENTMERNILRNMIHMKGKRKNKASLLAEGKVRFNVVSEPLSDDDSEAECIDIGYADVNIPNILLDGHDIVKDDAPIMNCNGTKEVIGYLNISILAYDVLKTLCGHSRS
ncbi:protein fantom-like [Ischnura elegans]|uniref:protein fantom-like n=1 Tax=Ischnura elegans TaxID=197161 RepID=UPI001ED8B5B1|nr:protein fantom-like [Ischnura elegans]